MHFVIVTLVFLLMVTVLVAAHEYGHFLFARLNRMEVEEFSIGLGKPAWVWMRRKGTEYSFRPLPLGGFVRIKGMVPQEDGSEIEVPNGFYSKSPLARLSVLFAGPLFSVLAGIVLLTMLFATVGQQVQTPYLGPIISKSAAEKAGLKEGDLVLKVDNKPISTWFQMQAEVRSHAETPITMEVNHQGQIENVTLTPKKSDVPLPLVDINGDPVGGEAYGGQIGVYPTTKVERLPIGAAVEESVRAPVKMVIGLGALFKKPSNFGDMMGGPGTIVVATSDATKEGPYQVIFLAALLSISLGIMNLLPIYPLDGGQMTVAFAELLRRGKRLSIEIQGLVNSVGFALVGLLIISVLWVDFRRFVDPDKPAPAAHSQQTVPAKK
ncbi:MAG TPA: M50 family metallopeptidase [Fimbriimonadaceae bacterium]